MNEYDQVVENLVRSRRTVTMEDAFDLLRINLPVVVVVRVIAIQAGNLSWLQRLFFRIGMFFLKRSGLTVGERE